MRILLISRCPPYPLHFGDRLILYHLARELSTRGHRIDLLAFYHRPEDPHEQAHYGDYFRHIELFAEPQRAPLDYLRRLLCARARWPRHADGAWSPQMWRAIERQLSQNDYDAAHLFGGVQVYEFRHALGDVPALIVPYESYSLYLRRMVESRHRGTTRGGKARLAPKTLIAYFQWFIARRFERWMFAPYRCTVVVSEHDRDELLALNPHLHIEVIPNGIDLNTFQWHDETREAATLLFTGNYEYAPNADAALHLARDIFPVVRTRIPEAQLWLVGHAPTAAMRALANEHILVTGRVPDVRPYLAQATVFVSPLRLGAGIKNKVLEALAMGCPVVATPLSVDGIHVQHERDALVAEDDALAAHIVRLLRDERLRRSLAVNGRRLIEAHYQWEGVATRYEQLYTALQERAENRRL